MRDESSSQLPVGVHHNRVLSCKVNMGCKIDCDIRYFRNLSPKLNWLHKQIFPLTCNKLLTNLRRERLNHPVYVTVL